MPFRIQRWMLSTTFLIGLFVVSLTGPLAHWLDRLMPRPFVQYRVSVGARRRAWIPAKKRISKPVAPRVEKHWLRPVYEPKPELLTFNSFGMEYIYTFSGTTRCKGRPCAANLWVSLVTDSEQEPKTLQLRSGQDGNYQFQTPFRGKPAQPMSFTITATSDDLLTAEVSGHRILSDDSHGGLTQDLQLR
jgi:hypothetical protein